MSLIKGLDNFMEILDVLKDPNKYDAKIQELVEQTKRYTEAVEGVTKLSEVNEYTQSIKTREEESKKVLAEAKAEANALVVQAQAKADGLMAKAQEATQKASRDSEAALARVSAALTREELVAVSEGLLAKAKEEFNIKDKMLSDLGDELNERKAKLLAAMG
jgi:cell division septum initiation protein DivIVA